MPNLPVTDREYVKVLLDEVGLTPDTRVSTLMDRLAEQEEQARWLAMLEADGLDMNGSIEKYTE